MTASSQSNSGGQATPPHVPDPPKRPTFAECRQMLERLDLFLNGAPPTLVDLVDERLRKLLAEYGLVPQAAGSAGFSAPTYSQPTAPQGAPASSVPPRTQQVPPAGPPASQVPPPPVPGPPRAQTPPQAAPPAAPPATPPAPLVPQPAVIHPSPVQPKALNPNAVLPPDLLDVLRTAVRNVRFRWHDPLSRYGAVAEALFRDQFAIQQWSEDALLKALALESVSFYINDARLNGAFRGMGHYGDVQLKAVNYVAPALQALNVPADFLGPVSLMNHWILQAVDIGLAP